MSAYPWNFEIKSLGSTCKFDPLYIGLLTLMVIQKTYGNFLAFNVIFKICKFGSAPTLNDLVKHTGGFLEQIYMVQWILCTCNCAKGSVIWKLVLEEIVEVLGQKNKSNARQTTT